MPYEPFVLGVGGALQFVELKASQRKRRQKCSMLTDTDSVAIALASYRENTISRQWEKKGQLKKKNPSFVFFPPPLFPVFSDFLDFWVFLFLGN